MPPDGRHVAIEEDERAHERARHCGERPAPRMAREVEHPQPAGDASGALPAGLTLTAAGVLSGTPTTAGITVFTIRGTDASGCFAEIA